MSGQRTINSEDLIGLLDIGSSKVVCAVAHVIHDRSGVPQFQSILGLGHCRSRGVTSGVVVNLDEAEEAVRTAVSQAERMAGVTIERVIATVSCGRIASQRFHAHEALAGAQVNRTHLERLQEAAEDYTRRGGRLLIHCNRIGFAVDGLSGVSDPIGLVGERLTGTYHAINGDYGPIRNLSQLIGRCLLDSVALVPAPVASALAVTTAQERDLGIVVLDLGGGTTSFAEYGDGQLIDCGVLPFGGELVTYDVARRLGAALSEAERIKTLYGTMVASRSDADALISYATGGFDGSDGAQTNRAELHQIVKSRIMRQISAVIERQSGGWRSDAGPWQPPRVVLTGGGSQLTAIASAYSDRLGGVVTLRRPQALPGLASQVAGPQFAALCGLVQCLPHQQSRRDRGQTLGQQHQPGAAHPSPGGLRRRVKHAGYVDRLQQWLREAF